MTFTPVEVKNNSSSSLKNPIISVNDTIIELPDWEWGRFTTENFPISVYIKDNIWRITSFEQMWCVSRDWDLLTVIRWYGLYRNSYTSNVYSNIKSLFVEWSIVEAWINAEMWLAINTELERLESTKLNIVDFQKQIAIYWASSTWNDDYAISLTPAPTSLSSWFSVKFLSDVWNIWPATLNINGLWAKTIKKKNDQDLSDWDIEAYQVVEVVYNAHDDIFEMVSQEASVINIVVWNLQKQNLTAWDWISANWFYRSWYIWDWNLPVTQPWWWYFWATTYTVGTFTFTDNQTINSVWVYWECNWWSANWTMYFYNWAALLWTSVAVTWISSWRTLRTFTFTWWVVIPDWVDVTVKISSNLNYNYFNSPFIVNSTEDTSKMYKASSIYNKTSNVKWVSAWTVTTWNLFTWYIKWIVWWFTWLTPWLPVYLTDTGSYSHTAWSIDVYLWDAYSSTEIFIDIQKWKYISSASLSSSWTTLNSIPIPSDANFALIKRAHIENTSYTYSQDSYWWLVIAKKWLTTWYFWTNITSASNANVNITWWSTLNFQWNHADVVNYTVEIYFYNSL